MDLGNTKEGKLSRTKNIASFFKLSPPKENKDLVDRPNDCNSEKLGYPQFVHVQQKNASDRFWDLCPSHILSQQDPVFPSVSSSTEAWQWMHSRNGTISRDRECTESSSTLSLNDAIKKLQRQFPSFEIKQMFDHYCSSREDSKQGEMVCSIPVVQKEGRLHVDDLAFTRRGNCIYGIPWTQAYQPTRVELMIGNLKSCSALLQWMSTWIGKPLACRREAKKDDPDFICSSESDEEEGLAPAALLHGPHGCGKTTAVYTCAAELGLSVFEVNASVLRSKSQLLQKLKEATLSHRVHSLSNTMEKRKSSVCLSTNTVILFDEVDVVFREDHGFLQAVQEIVSSSKRPVILTCSDPPLDLQVKFLKLQFSSPSESEVAVHLCLLSLANGWPLPLDQSLQISRHFHCDIRKAILYMQLMLSWQPTDPFKLLDDIDPAPTRFTPPLSISKDMFFPWHIPHPVTHDYNFSDLEMESISLLGDIKGAVDCIKGRSHHLMECVHRSWLSIPKANVLDEFPSEGFPPRCSLGQDVIETLCFLSGVDLTPESDIHDNAKRTPKHHVIKNVFHNHWLLARTTLATEGLPFLEMMYKYDNLKRENGSGRMRQSRHYFHPHFTHLKDFFD